MEFLYPGIAEERFLCRNRLREPPDNLLLPEDSCCSRCFSASALSRMQFKLTEDQRNPFPQYAENFMALTEQQLQCFQNALAFFVLSDSSMKQGIGTEKEKTLHAVLKY